jgi:hypothetical protein
MLRTPEQTKPADDPNKADDWQPQAEKVNGKYEVVCPWYHTKSFYPKGSIERARFFVTTKFYDLRILTDENDVLIYPNIQMSTVLKDPMKIIAEDQAVAQKVAKLLKQTWDGAINMQHNIGDKKTATVIASIQSKLIVCTPEPKSKTPTENPGWQSPSKLKRIAEAAKNANAARAAEIDGK